mmetsp:Transcript_17776/g.28888  ORF Transcript_17776/g.28888 Transcript_17776/m.28888 type:complete len:903 (+) Transcript_17776:157-2865(+)
MVRAQRLHIVLSALVCRQCQSERAIPRHRLRRHMMTKRLSPFMSTRNTSLFSGSGVIGGRAFYDENNDGMRDEFVHNNNINGIEGINVTLFQCDPSTSLASFKTNVNGWYTFTDLSPGKYYIVAQPPSGYEFSDIFDNTNTDTPQRVNENDENAVRVRDLGTGGVISGIEKNTIDPESGRTIICINLEEGEQALSWGFGLFKTSEKPSAQPSISNAPIDLSNSPTSESSDAPSIYSRSSNQPSWSPTASSRNPTSPTPSIYSRPSNQPASSSSSVSSHAPSISRSSHQPSWSPTASSRNPSFIPSGNPSSMSSTVKPTSSKISNDPISNDPTVEDSSVPSLMPSVTTDSQWAYNDANSFSEIDNNIDDNSSDDANSFSDNSIIGITCGVAFLGIIAVASFVFYQKRRTNGGPPTLPPSEVHFDPKTISDGVSDFGDFRHASVSSSNSGENSPDTPALSASSSSSSSLEDEAVTLSTSYSYPPGRPSHQHHSKSSRPASFPRSNLDQGYNNSGWKQSSQSQSISHSITQGLSSASSHSGEGAERKTIQSIEHKLHSLSSAIRSFPENSETWLLLHSCLERAREELDAVRSGRPHTNIGREHGLIDQQPYHHDTANNKNNVVNTMHPNQEKFVCGMGLFVEDNSSRCFYTGQIDVESQLPHGLGTLRRDGDGTMLEGEWIGGRLVQESGMSGGLVVQTAHLPTALRDIEIIAPPSGNLGLLEDKSPSGGEPVRNRSLDSFRRLGDQIQLKDQIIAIDDEDEDVQQMSQHDVSNLFRSKKMEAKTKSAPKMTLSQSHDDASITSSTTFISHPDIDRIYEDMFCRFQECESPSIATIESHLPLFVKPIEKSLSSPKHSTFQSSTNVSESEENRTTTAPTSNASVETQDSPVVAEAPKTSHLLREIS